LISPGDRERAIAACRDIAGHKAGHEIEHPMAVVILGGLITSTLLNHLLLPALHERFGRSVRIRSSAAL
jgi:Cu/Ag efflux pump CusA